MRYQPSHLVALAAVAHQCAHELAPQINETCVKIGYPQLEGNCLDDAFATLHLALRSLPNGTDLASAIHTGASALFEAAVSPATVLLAQTWRVAAHHLPAGPIRAVEILDTLEGASLALVKAHSTKVSAYDPITTMFTEINTRLGELGGEARPDQMLLCVASEIFSATLLSGRIELLGLALIALSNPQINQESPHDSLLLILDEITQRAGDTLNLVWLDALSGHEDPALLPAEITRLSGKNPALCAQQPPTLASASWVGIGPSIDTVGALAAGSKIRELARLSQGSLRQPARRSSYETVITLGETSALQIPKILFVDTEPTLTAELNASAASYLVTASPRRMWRLLRSHQPQLIITLESNSELVAQTLELNIQDVADIAVRTPTLFDLPATNSPKPQTAGPGQEAPLQAIPVLRVSNYAQALILIQALTEPIPQLLASADKRRLLEGRAAHAYANYSENIAELKVAWAPEIIGICNYEDTPPQAWAELNNLTLVRLQNWDYPPLLGGLLR